MSHDSYYVRLERSYGRSLCMYLLYTLGIKDTARRFEEISHYLFSNFISRDDLAQLPTLDT
jgi:hypothetical protein